MCLIKKFDYNERLEKESDDISILFLDKNESFIYDNFLPQRGDIITPTLFFEHWYNEGESHEIPFGEFEVDEFEIENSTSGQTISIKAVPALIKGSLSGQEKTRAWENVKLQTIAKDIAAHQGVELVYHAEEILLQRVDQKKEADLIFLTRLCRQNGLHLKVADNKIIIEEAKKQEQRQIITTADYYSFNLRVQSQDVYNGVHIKYYDALEEKHFEYSYTPKNAPKVGKMLELNTRVESYAQAEKIAKALLWEKNKKSIEMSMKIFPNPFIRCGSVIEFPPAAYLNTR